MFRKHCQYTSNLSLMVARTGFEPIQNPSKGFVLPLHYRATFASHSLQLRQIKLPSKIIKLFLSSSRSFINATQSLCQQSSHISIEHVSSRYLSELHVFSIVIFIFTKNLVINIIQILYLSITYINI
jgi:hypothetical protein